MTLETVKEIAVKGGGVMVVLFTLIQITPIKVNPWSLILKALGRAMFGDLMAKMDEFSQDLKSLREENAEWEAKNSRVRILRFGDEILHGMKHSKEHFNQILADITEYNRYCRDHPDFANDRTTITTKRIKDTYEKCLIERSFEEE